jgi:hypothetical protein
VPGRLSGLVTLALALTLPAVAADARSFTIEARGSDSSFGEVRSIGDFKPRRDPTLGAAIDAYGQPESTRARGSASCKVVWPELGVRILFVNLGGGSACDPRYGKAQGARVRARSEWHTRRGLHVGDGVSRLRRLYPGARRHGSSYWLVTGISLYGPANRAYPVLAAIVRGDEVRSFKLEIGAAGD